jgi:hypothetical protein
MNGDKQLLQVEIVTSARLRFAAAGAACVVCHHCRRSDSVRSGGKWCGIRVFFQSNNESPHSHRTAPHRTAPHRTAPHRTAPHRTAPHRTAPHRSGRQEDTHPHMVHLSRDHSKVLIPDLGLDVVYALDYAAAAEEGGACLSVSQLPGARSELAQGLGPRHMALHPTLNVA